MARTLVIALGVAAFILLLFWRFSGRFLLPVCLGRDQTLSIILRTADSAAGLESTVRSLLWLIENGTLPASIIIEDAGLSAEAQHTALLLAKQHDCIHFRAYSEEQAWISRST